MKTVDIPGFYYDEEKKKYFKIQAGHSATGSKYTHETIKREADESKKRKRIQERRAIQIKERVQRSKLHGWSSMSVVELQRQSGDLSIRRSPAQYQMRSFVKQLECAPLTRQKMLDPTMFEPASCDGRYLAYIPRGTEHVLGMVSEGGPDEGEEAVLWDEISAGPSITSMNLSQESQMLVTAQQGPWEGFRIYTDDLTTWDPYMKIWNKERWRNSYTTSRPEREMITEIRNLSLFAAETLFIPGSPNMRMLLGTNRGMIVIDFSSHQDSIVSFDSDVDTPTSSDVVCTTWLTPQTAAFSTRRGVVGVVDDRIQTTPIEFRVSTASMVFKLCRTDDPARLIVSGLRDHLAMYDTRMLRKGVRNRASPAIKYNHSNKTTFPLGLDVHPETGLMAAADDRSNIHTYSIRTGEIVKTFTPNELQVRFKGENATAGDPVAFLRFKDGHRTGPSILASAVGGIVECRF